MTDEQTHQKGGELVIALTPKELAIVAAALVALILLRRRCRAS